MRCEIRSGSAQHGLHQHLPVSMALRRARVVEQRGSRQRVQTCAHTAQPLVHDDPELQGTRCRRLQPWRPPRAGNRSTPAPHQAQADIEVALRTYIDRHRLRLRLELDEAYSTAATSRPFHHSAQRSLVWAQPGGIAAALLEPLHSI